MAAPKKAPAPDARRDLEKELAAAEALKFQLTAIADDGESDTVLLKVHQVGDAACHEGYRTFFFRRVEGDSLQVVGERVFDPQQVYRK